VEKINYISVREEKFWKWIQGLFSGLGVLSLIFSYLFSDTTKPFFYIFFISLMISSIAGIPQHFSDKDISEIRKRVFWHGVFSVLYGIFVFLYIQFVTLLETGILARSLVLVVILVPMLFFLFLAIFKTRIQQSHSFLRYLIDDEPPFWKRWFQKGYSWNNYFKSILGILLTLVVIGGFITFIVWGGKA
jgi:hypothetical protein